MSLQLWFSFPRLFSRALWVPLKFHVLGSAGTLKPVNFQRNHVDSVGCICVIATLTVFKSFHQPTWVDFTCIKYFLVFKLSMFFNFQCTRFAPKFILSILLMFTLFNVEFKKRQTSPLSTSLFPSPWGRGLHSRPRAANGQLQTACQTLK